jgi:hypothetical protein
MKPTQSQWQERIELSPEVAQGKAALLRQLSERLGMTAVQMDGSAQANGALVRKREVKSGFDLLHLALAYAVCDWSLRLVGLWAVLVGIGSLSAVAIRQRLQQSDRWLGKLVGEALRQRQVGAAAPTGVRLRLQDATTVSKPGSKGSDYRVHLLFNVGESAVEGVALSDAHTGESLALFPGQVRAIRVADRGYGYASSLGPLLAAGEELLVRINWQNLPLQQPTTGQRFDLPAWLTSLHAASECAVQVPTPQGTFPLRLIAAPLPPAKVAEAHRRVRLAARKKGRTPKAETLLAAGFVLLLTNLPSDRFDLPTVLAFYLLRWQVEMHFKRLKSLLSLDGLRCQDTHLSQSYLLAKLLAALLCDQTNARLAALQPTWFADTAQPISLWRLTALAFDNLRALIRCQLSAALVELHLPRLRRYLCSSPRKRTDQAALARQLVASLLSSC